MADFNPDKLNERLEQLNKEQLATMEKLVAELMAEMEEAKEATKPSHESDRSPKH